MTNVKQIKNYTEKMWFLGTDVLEGGDLDLMEKGDGVVFLRGEGAIYGITNHFLDRPNNYSYKFNEIMREAFSRGYAWVLFDRDIATQFNKGIKQCSI